GYVDGEFEISSTGELIIDGGEFIVENSSTSANNIYGTLSMTDGLFQIDHGLHIKSSANTYISGGMIRVGGFRANAAGTFEPTGGTLEIQTNNSGYGLIDCSAGNYLYNLNINPTGIFGGGGYLYNDLLITHNLDIPVGGLWFDGYSATVNGNTTISGGLRMVDATDVLNAGNDATDLIMWEAGSSLEFNEKGRINIFGNCTLENGVNDSISADQTIAFVGTGDQSLNNYDDATFGTVELAKPSGQLIIPASSEVTCQSYDWTSGTLTADGGSFTAQDLADIKINGTTNLYGGLIDFTQDASSAIFLCGEFNITGGTFNIRGGNSYFYWTNSDELVFNMSDGMMDIIDMSLIILNNESLTMNVTGGHIRTNSFFDNDNPGFQCNGGLFEMTGHGVNVECYEGYFNALKINGGNIFLLSDLVLHGDLMIDAGWFIDHAQEITCLGDLEINSFGNLELNSGSTIKLGNNSSFNVKWNGGFGTYGDEGDMNLITAEGAGDHYHFTVENGGFINPRYTVFERMSANGLFLDEDVYVGVQCFNNCIFREGQEGGALLTINSDESFIMDGAEFQSSAKGSNYNITKTNDDGHVTLTNYSGNFAGSAHENDPYNRIDWFTPELTVAPSVRNVTASSGTTTFNVSSNIDWTVSETTAWFSVNPMSGSNDLSITVTYDENLLLTPRSGTVTLSGDDVPDVVVTVNQAGATPELAVTPANRDVSAAAGTTTFGITSNTSWTVSESVSWFTVAPMSGSYNGTLTVNYNENTSITGRVGSITISAADVPDVIVTVSQAGADPELSVDPANRDVTAIAGSTTFDVNSNTGWTVSESVGWLSV
nr:BACON domain-containing protein [Bacteroidota bacterium]